MLGDSPATDRSLTERVGQGVRSAPLGLMVNAGLAVIKLIAGLAGNSYALVADAIESGGSGR